jgi:hypothetical protein
MNLIVIEKINVEKYFEKYTQQIEEKNNQHNLLIESKKNKLAPYIGKALYAFVDFHNQLLKSKCLKFFENENYIDEPTDFVNKILQDNSSWGIRKATNSNDIAVTFNKYHIYFWLSDNPGGAKYTTNPIYQTYISRNCYPKTVEEYVEIKIKLFLESNLLF